MIEFEDGGPAFPVVHEQYDYGYEQKMPKQVAPGMTLRDYFAANAMVRIMSYDKDGVMSPETLASASYRLADAMLRAREQS